MARGPAYGYYPNASKSVLLVKPRVLELAQELFADTAVQIRTDGYRHLGAVLGTEGYCQQYVQGKVASWCSEVRRLATYATSQPQAAYSALCQGLKHKWSFVARTIRNAASLMQPLEDAIHQDLIPALTGRPTPVEGWELSSPQHSGPITPPHVPSRNHWLPTSSNKSRQWKASPSSFTD